MTVIDLHTLRTASPPNSSVICLGNFDGVHIGHQKLIEATVQKKEELSQKQSGVKSGACFFRRAPIEFILNKQLPILTDEYAKLEIFAALGLDYAFILDFKEVGQLSPAEFVSEILLKELNCIFAVCGYNFRFGKGASGTAETLFELMERKAFIVDEVLWGSQKVSSSEIRRLISEGEIERANSLLGRNFSINEKVVHGKQLGRTLGIPTVNQPVGNRFPLLKNGIYVSRTLIDGIWFPSVSNFGVRPSVEDGNSINCETHIIGYDGDLYEKRLKVEFIHRLRDEKKFADIEALKAQIEKDISDTKKYFEK
jgi:riboflavin kinase/FMN adenylyltransferase